MPSSRLTTAEDIAARQASGRSTTAGASGGKSSSFSEEEKAKRKERVERAKDALARSTNLKGEHVVAGRAALKLFLRSLNDARQPSDEQFEAIIEAPFTAPPKKGPIGGGGRR
jgi:hypothetical protein